MQAHGRLTVDILFLYSLTHEVDPPFRFAAGTAIQLPEMGHKGINGHRPFPIGRTTTRSGRNSFAEVKNDRGIACSKTSETGTAVPMDEACGHPVGSSGNCGHRDG